MTAFVGSKAFFFYSINMQKQKKSILIVAMAWFGMFSW